MSKLIDFSKKKIKNEKYKVKNGSGRIIFNGKFKLDAGKNRSIKCFNCDEELMSLINCHPNLNLSDEKRVIKMEKQKGKKSEIRVNEILIGKLSSSNNEKNNELELTKSTIVKKCNCFTNGVLTRINDLGFRFAEVHIENYDFNGFVGFILENEFLWDSERIKESRSRIVNLNGKMFIETKGKVCFFNKIGQCFFEIFPQEIRLEILKYLVDSNSKMKFYGD